MTDALEFRLNLIEAITTRARNESAEAARSGCPISDIPYTSIDLSSELETAGWLDGYTKQKAKMKDI